MPAAGFAMGDVVLAELLKERGLLPEYNPSLDVYVMVEDEALRKSTLRLVQQMRDSGLHAEYPLMAAKPDKQFKRALELGARFTVRLTDEGTALLKNLESREETVLEASAVTERLM
jgi:histidyl-tRNA synthetase